MRSNPLTRAQKTDPNLTCETNISWGVCFVSKELVTER